MNKTEVLGAFLLANIPEIITQEEFDDVKKAIKELQQENQQLKAKIKTYEDPEDLTLMFMYCNEKAKDKIKELEEQLKTKHDGFMASVNESCELAKYNQTYKEVINKIKEVCNSIPSTHSICGIEKIHDIENILNEVE